MKNDQSVELKKSNSLVGLEEHLLTPKSAVGFKVKHPPELIPIRNVANDEVFRLYPDHLSLIEALIIPVGGKPLSYNVMSALLVSNEPFNLG